MNIVLIGKPGCGKGTLAQSLVDAGWFHLSPGNLMREKMKDSDEVAHLLRELLNKGNFAPDHITIDLVKSTVAKLPKNTNVLFDGFPRTLTQAKMLKDTLPVDLIVYFDISDKIITQRITNRLMHPGSGRIYNRLFNPPKSDGVDDITGEKLVTRDDDKPELIEQRLRNFMDLTYPGYIYLKNEGVPVLEVNGAGTSDQIYQKVKITLESIEQTNVPSKAGVKRAL